MLYGLFLFMAILYNWRKFTIEREALISSLIDAKSLAHREMILGHHFHVFIFEGFLAVLVAHLVTEKAHVIGLVGLGCIYVALLVFGYFIYQYFLKFIERETQLELRASFNHNLIKELRVSFALIMLPILIYSIINWTFQDSVYKEWGSLWYIGILANILFVSVLTLICTVIIMLKLMPNMEITEPEYLEIINKRATQAGVPNLRVRWIEAEVKNAFVVGIKLLKFSNQTMFIGRGLRKALTLEEFDAVVAHEIAHVVNGHSSKRVVELMKNFISIILGCMFLVLLITSFLYLLEGEDFALNAKKHALLLAMTTLPPWVFFNYSLLFDTLRSHEFEADAYAVMEMGVSADALISALEKLTAVEIPDYLKARRNTQDKGYVGKWLQRNFSTHPDISTRKNFLLYKMENALPFNYYVSSAKKAQTFLASFFQWRVVLPSTVACGVIFTMMVLDFKEGKELVGFVASAPREKILENEKVAEAINERPFIGGRSLMYYIVMRRDPVLVDYYLSKGADEGHTLHYISELKDLEMFKRYYSAYQEKLTDDEYFLILKKTASRNFTEGYRYLVNSERFEKMSSDYKTDLSQLHKAKTQRLPASVVE